MKTFILCLLVLFCFSMAGCAILDKIAPSKLDEAGQPIPGSREPINFVQTVAGAIPYGEVALSVLLLGVAGYEKFRAYKLEKGLMATLLAGKQVANDEELKEMWEVIKQKYELAHQNAGVTDLIKTLLAKLPRV